MRSDKIKGGAFSQALQNLTRFSHHRIHKVKEIYADEQAIYLISDSLSGQYKSLVEYGPMDEQEVASVLK